MTKNILLFAACLVLVSCGSASPGDDPGDECLRLQTELNEATNMMQDALEAYTKDTGNQLLCANYADALRDRIDKAQAMIDANCLTLGAKTSTEQAIEEDKAEILRLGC